MGRKVPNPPPPENYVRPAPPPEPPKAARVDCPCRYCRFCHKRGQTKQKEEINE